MGADAMLYRTLRLVDEADGSEEYVPGDKELALLLTSSVVTDALQTLDLEGTSVTGKALSILPHKVPNLRHLSIYGVYIYPLLPIVQCVEGLHSLRSLTFTPQYIAQGHLDDIEAANPELVASLGINRIAQLATVPKGDMVYVNNGMYRVEAKAEGRSRGHRTFMFYLTPVLPDYVGAEATIYRSTNEFVAVYDVTIEPFVVSGPPEWRPRLHDPETGAFVKRTPHPIRKDMYDTIQAAWEDAACAGDSASHGHRFPVELHTFGTKSVLAVPYVVDQLPEIFTDQTPVVQTAGDQTPHIPWM